MKKILITITLIALALSVTACKKEPAETPVVEEEKGYDSFREETTEMTVEDAEAYLEEHTDDTTPEYKEAVYTVTENTVAEIIEEAREKEKETAAVKKVFEGIFFKFREGSDFSDTTIRQKLFMQGNWEEESGWYRFTFIDRTLSEGALTMDNDYALKEYTYIIELLLSDSNVIVKPLE